jgi:hypothetical protein
VSGEADRGRVEETDLIVKRLLHCIGDDCLLTQPQRFVVSRSDDGPKGCAKIPLPPLLRFFLFHGDLVIQSTVTPHLQRERERAMN